VKIITAPGSTFDPIAIASNAPTPVKRLKVFKGLKTKTIRRTSPDANATAGSSKKCKVENTVAASSSAATRVTVVQGKKRARPASPTPGCKKEKKYPAYLGKVVDVSDFKESDDKKGSKK